MKHFFAIPFFALLILAGCSSAPKPVDTRAKDIESIRAAEIQNVNDWASRDVERIARFWAEDATLMMPGRPAIVGKTAIKAAVQEILADPKFAITLSNNATDVSKSGDIGYTQGAATITMTDPKSKKVITETDKYVTVFKKQADGAWLAVQDINNSDGAPNAVAAAATDEKPSAVAPSAKAKAKRAKPAKKKAAAKRRKR
jgi:uncharacterized protein (TIGR02246 family)